MSKQKNYAGEIIYADDVVILGNHGVSSRTVKNISSSISQQQNKQDLDGIRNDIDGITSDKLIVPSEKQGLEREWANLRSSYVALKGKMTQSGLADSVPLFNLTKSIDALTPVMDDILADMTVPYPVPEGLRLSEMFVDSWKKFNEADYYFNESASYSSKYQISVDGGTEVPKEGSGLKLTCKVYKGDVLQDTPEFLDDSEYVWSRYEDSASWPKKTGRSVRITAADMVGNETKFLVQFQHKIEGGSVDNPLLSVAMVTFVTLIKKPIIQYAWSNDLDMQQSEMEDYAWTETIPSQPIDRKYLWTRESRDYGVSWLLYRKTGQQGPIGPTGWSRATVPIYTRSADAPLSYVDEYGPAGTGEATNAYYTFSTAVLEMAFMGRWSKEMPQGSDKLWVIYGTFFSDTNRDEITPGEWTPPVELSTTGAQGEAGKSFGPVYIYRRSSTDLAAADLPQKEVTFNFKTNSIVGLENTGWFNLVPTGGDPLWVATTTAVSTNGESAIITPGRWAPPRVMVQDGVSITGVSQQYAVTASETIAPDEDEWTDVKPDRAETQVLWTRNKYTYSNGTFSYTDGVPVTGDKGSPGADGLPGQDGQKGENPVVVLCERPVYVFPADMNGLIDAVEYEKYSTKIFAQQGDRMLKYDRNLKDPLSFYVAVEADEINVTFTSGNEGTVGYAKIATGPNSSLLGSTGMVTYRVHYKDVDSNVSSLQGFITFTKAPRGFTGPDGPEGQYTAMQYYLSTSDTELLNDDWRDEMPIVTPGRYLWTRSQVVEAGGKINDKGWSQPFLSNVNIVALKDKIALTVTEETDENGNRVVRTAAGIRMGILVSKEGDPQIGYLKLNADSILMEGSLTIRKDEESQSRGDVVFIEDGAIRAKYINTDELFAQQIVIPPLGSIESSEFDSTKVGFKIDGTGQVTIVGMTADKGTFNNITVDKDSTFLGNIETDYLKVKQYDSEDGADYELKFDQSPKNGWMVKDLVAKFAGLVHKGVHTANPGSTYNDKTVDVITYFGEDMLNENGSNSRTLAWLPHRGSWTAPRAMVVYVSCPVFSYTTTTTSGSWVTTSKTSIHGTINDEPVSDTPPSNPQDGDTYVSYSIKYDSEGVRWSGYRIVHTYRTSTTTHTHDGYVTVYTGHGNWSVNSGRSDYFTMKAGEKLDVRFTGSDSLEAQLWEKFSSNYKPGLTFIGPSLNQLFKDDDTTVQSTDFAVNGVLKRNVAKYTNFLKVYKKAKAGGPAEDTLVPSGYFSNFVDGGMPTYTYTDSTGKVVSTPQVAENLNIRDGQIVFNSGVFGTYSTESKWYSAFTLTFTPRAFVKGMRTASISPITQGEDTVGLKDYPYANGFFERIEPDVIVNVPNDATHQSKVWGAVAN